MKRNKNSHKGQNGKVMIVGGSEHFYGAPILCSLGAEYSGVDLVFPFLPPSHAQAAKGYSLNFILHAFAKDHLTMKDVALILEFSARADVVVMGPGLGDHPDTQKAVLELLKKLEKPTVVDASALIYTNQLPSTVVLTPHRGEFKTLTGDDPTPENVQKWAENLNATIICKGPEDIIATADKISINKTGNSLMTVGGTGDVLSGLIGGLIARGHEPIAACEIAADTLGKIADKLAHTQTSIRAIDLAVGISGMLH